MTEAQFNQWLEESSKKTVSHQKFIMYSQLILSAALLLFILAIIPIVIFMGIIFMAIASYKRTADELALMTMSLQSLEEELATEKQTWFAQHIRYQQALTLLKTTISRLIQHNKQYGYRILFYMILTILAYFLF